MTRRIALILIGVTFLLQALALPAWHLLEVSSAEAPAEADCGRDHSTDAPVLCPPVCEDERHHHHHGPVLPHHCARCPQGWYAPAFMASTDASNYGHAPERFRLEPVFTGRRSGLLIASPRAPPAIL